MENPHNFSKLLWNIFSTINVLSFELNTVLSEFVFRNFYEIWPYYNLHHILCTLTVCLKLSTWLCTWNFFKLFSLEKWIEIDIFPHCFVHWKLIKNILVLYTGKIITSLTWLLTFPTLMMEECFTLFQFNSKCIKICLCVC